MSNQKLNLDDFSTTEIDLEQEKKEERQYLAIVQQRRHISNTLPLSMSAAEVKSHICENYKHLAW